MSNTTTTPSLFDMLAPAAPAAPAPAPAPAPITDTTPGLMAAEAAAGAAPDLPAGAFVSLSVSAWTASRKIAGGTLDTQDADPAMVRAQKDLVDRRELRAITSITSEARATLAGRALPFDLSGVYFIPAALLVDVTDRLAALERDFTSAADSFALRYDTMRDEARRRLGSLYREDDYPAGIRGRFAWRLRVFTFATPSSLQTISPDLYRQAEAGFRRDLQEFRANACALLRERFASVVEHLADRLAPGPDGGRKVFHDTALTHVTDFLRDFEALNIANDGELRAQVERVRSLVSGVQPDHLRSGAHLAATVRTSLETVTAALDPLITDAPRRRVRMASPAAAPAAATSPEAKAGEVF